MERTEDSTRASAPDILLEGSYFDWPAILGGGVVAVAVGAVFAGFGTALGLSTVPVLPEEGGFNLMLILGALWIVVTLVASYLTGGYIAGRMRRRVDSVKAEEVTARDGLNGLAVWGLGTLVSVVLLGSAVAQIGAVAAKGAEVAVTAGADLGVGALQTAAAVVPVQTDPMARVSHLLLRPDAATSATPARIEADTSAILGQVLATGEISTADRAYLVSAVALVAGVPPAEAMTRVDALVLATQTSRKKATEALTEAKTAADAAASTAQEAAVKLAEAARVSAILTAFLLAASAMVAAAAAYVGAVRGGRHRDEGRLFAGFSYRG